MKLALLAGLAVASTALSATQTKAAKVKPDPEAAMKAKAEANIKTVCIAIITYANDFADRLPQGRTQDEIDRLIAPYIANTRNPLAFKDPNPAGGRFLFNLAMAGAAPNRRPDPQKMLLVYEKNAWKDGSRLVGYADGKVKWLDAKTWKVEQTKVADAPPPRATRRRNND